MFIVIHCSVVWQNHIYLLDFFHWYDIKSLVLWTFMHMSIVHGQCLDFFAPLYFPSNLKTYCQIPLQNVYILTGITWYQLINLGRINILEYLVFQPINKTYLSTQIDFDYFYDILSFLRVFEDILLKLFLNICDAITNDIFIIS